MKRLIISVVLLGLVGSLCAWSLYTQKTGTEELLEMLDDMEQTYKEKDYKHCQQLSDEFPIAYNKKAKAFSLFLHHSYLSSAKEVAVTLPVILREKDYAHYLTELSRCRSLLEKLEELELPTWNNVL